MALLSFPPNPSNGQYFPVNPPAGDNIYQWSSTDVTWRLVGVSSGATPGTYGTPIAVPEITIDATGRIIFAQNIPIQLGTTSQVGLVQLTDNTTSNDDTTALTAAQGYFLQNQIGNTALLNPAAPNLVTAINGATAPSGVSAGTYGTSTQVGTFTVNTQGRITSATNVLLALATTSSVGVVRVGSNLNVTGTGLLSVPTATTAVAGVSQLVNNTTTNDSTKSLTAAQGYSLQQQINAIEVKSNLTFAGSLNANTGVLTQITPEGAAAGFVAGNPLPFPSSFNDEYFVVVDTGGTYAPPGGLPLACSPGDWFLSDGASWIFYDYKIGSVSLVNTGAGLAGGPITTTGTISVVPATTTTLGGVIPDGSTITVSTGGLISTRQYVTQVATGTGLSGGPITTSGTVSVVPATTTALGGVIPDGTSISVAPSGIISTVNNGTVTSVGTGAGLTGGPITSSGTVSVVPATTTALGGVIPDGVTITVSPTGVIASPVQKFVYLDDISAQFNGTLAAFTLRLGGTPYAPVPSTNVMITVGGVLQDPNSAYSVSGSTITFTGAPPTGASFIGVTVS